MSSPRFTVYGRKAKSVQQMRIVPLVGTAPRIPRRRQPIQGLAMLIVALVIAMWVAFPLLMLVFHK